MNTIDWTLERPEDKALKSAFKEMKITEITELNHSSKNLLNLAEANNSNGTVKLFRYRLDYNDDINWFVSRNRFNEINFLKKVILNKQLQTLHRTLNTSVLNLNIKLPKQFGNNYTMNPFILSGELSSFLYFGGPYGHAESQDAWKISNDFVIETFNNDFESLVMFNIDLSKVGSFFYKIAWDYSLAIFNKSDQSLTILISTDTDERD